MKHFYIVALVGLGLSGCSSSAGFTWPKIDFLNGQNTYHNQEIQNAQTVPSPMAQWWVDINDPILTENIQTLLSNNLTLKQGVERINQAQESVTSVQGNYYPTLGATAQTGRSFSSTASIGDRVYTNSYAANLTSSWQLDLFGKIKNQESRVDSLLKASIYDQEALEQSLVADLVQNHIAIATTQKILSLAKENLFNRNQILSLAKSRYNLGAENTTSGDIYAAEAGVTSAKADIADIERTLTQYGYAYDVLLGQKPGTTDILKTSFNFIEPQSNVASCLPLDLLDRRPDIKSSELRLKAAEVDIDIAIDTLYPSLSIAGALGFSGNDDSQFFSAEKLAGSLLGTITSSLFEGGKLRSNIRLQESEAREMSLAYSETILNAVSEVETALIGEDKIKAQIKNQKETVSSLNRSEKFVRNRYENGLQTLENYLDIQQNRYRAEQELYQLYQTEWNNRIALYLALGGDWFNNDNTELTCSIESNKS